MVNATPTNAPVMGPPTPPDMEPNSSAPQMPAKPPVAETPAPQMPQDTTPVSTPSASAPPMRLPKRGLMHSVLTGALKGAVDASETAGRVARQRASNFVNNSPYAQQLKNQALERQQKQQQMTEEAQKTQDEHTESMLRANGMSMDNMHKAAENAHLEEMYPGEEEAQRLTLKGQIRAQNDADVKLLTTLEEAGVHLDTSHYAQGSPFAQLTKDHATEIAKGNQIALNNGKTGPDADLAFVSTSDLANTVLPKDIQVVTDWNLDPKTGEMKPVYSTLQGGKNNALDALIAHNAGMDKFNQKQEMYTKQVEAQGKAAQAKEAVASAAEHQSAAALNDAYIKNMAGGGPGGTPTQQVSDAIAKMPPQVQADIQKYNPRIQGLLIRGAYGFIDPNTFPQKDYKGQFGIDRPTAEGMMNEINPQYSDSLWKGVSSTQTAFATGKEATSIRSFNQFLVHADELKKVSEEVGRTNTPLLNIPLNKLSAYMGQPGVPELMTAVEAARREWQSFIDSGYAPDKEQLERASVLMSDTSSIGQIQGVLGVMGTQAVGRLDQLNEQYKTVMGTDYPNLVTPSGAQAATRLGIDVGGYQSGGTIAQGGGTKLGAQQTVSVGGKSYPLNSDGTFTMGQYIYKPDGKGNATYVGPAQQTATPPAAPTGI